MKDVKSFNINGFYISANTREEAERVLSLIGLHQMAERLMIVDFGDRCQVIPFSDDQPVKIYTRQGKSIMYCGEIHAGSGYKLIQAAIDSVNISATESAKLSAAVKKANKEVRHREDKKVISDFEASIPDVAKSLYHDVTNRLDATTDAYKLEIIDGIIESGVTVRSHNWIPILSWFRDNVLNEEEKLNISNRRSFYVLRRAFVTTVVRMAGDNVRNANAMKLAKEDQRDGDFWSNYAENKSTGQ